MSPPSVDWLPVQLGSRYSLPAWDGAARPRRVAGVTTAFALTAVSITLACSTEAPSNATEPTTGVPSQDPNVGGPSTSTAPGPSNGAGPTSAENTASTPDRQSTTSNGVQPTSPASSSSHEGSRDGFTTESSEQPTHGLQSDSGESSSQPEPASVTLSGRYPCSTADPTTYDVTVIKDGQEWVVSRNASQVYTGASFETALTRAYSALDANRTSKQSILVLGDGEIPATSQVRIPSFVTLNVCGTVTVTGTPSGSDRSPFFARGAEHIEIPNLELAGSPQYGIFIRQTNDVHLGHIELRLTRNAGIGIRVDSGPNAGSSTDFNRNLAIDYVFGTGMGSHIVETYGIDGIRIGAVEGEDVGECGLLLNRSINAEVGAVTCSDCATGTGYAAFRVANSVGKIGNEFPSGNIHVGKVTARRGGRGFFSVSGCGGIVIDELDIADTGNTSILMQNTYNTVLAAKSGIVSGGLVQLTNDTNNTNNGTYPPSKDVTIQNLTLQNGASVRQDWCNEFGANGCIARNIAGGSTSMCSN